MVVISLDLFRRKARIKTIKRLEKRIKELEERLDAEGEIIGDLLNEMQVIRQKLGYKYYRNTKEWRT